MAFVVMLVLGSVAVALTVLFYPQPLGERRPWLLRTSWALWTLQPAILVTALMIALSVAASSGYDSSNIPDELDSWYSLAILGPVGIALLAGTVLGGLAWRSARLEQPPGSHRWWALTATIANTLWFAGGAWLMVSAPIALALDAVILVVALALLLWPLRSGRPDEPTQPSAADSPDQHLVA